MAAPVTRHSAYDVVIVGARVAGAATAMLLARAGLSVLAIDRSPYGSDILSTLALMRAGVLQLRRWGLVDAVKAFGTPPVRTTTFHYGDETIAVPIKARDGVDALYAPRRTVLDPLLVDAARQAGAEMVFGPRVTDLVRDTDGRVRGVTVEDRSGTRADIAASLVIGADGHRSTVARLVEAMPHHVGRHMTGIVYGYVEGLAADGYHWYFRPGVSAGVIPTNDGLTCVFASMPARRFLDSIRGDLPGGFRQVLAETSPVLAEQMAAATLVDRLRGFPGHQSLLRRSWGPGWALVGDAGYLKDSLTAHGMADALRDAELLARAVVAGTDAALAQYQTTRDDLSTRLLDVTDEIASFDWTLEELKALHHALSDEMKREVAYLRSLDEHVAVIG